jgi:acylphosphatase
VSARKIAGKLKVTGWIRNTREGDVEALVTGEAAQLLKFEDWCKHGPEDARVDLVTVTPHDEVPFDEFTIR